MSNLSGISQILALHETAHNTAYSGALSKISELLTTHTESASMGAEHDSGVLVRGAYVKVQL